MSKLQEIKSYAKKYRKELFEKFLSIGEGHPGSTFSMLDIVTTLYHGGYINPRKDKIVISKGHATVALYPILVNFKIIKREEWINWGTAKKSILRVFGNTSIPGIDATSGSLGHGVGVAFGMALAFKKNNSKNKVFVVISEGELYEGSTWEALLIASHHNLDNLTIIIDINSLIILGNTNDCVKLNPILDKVKGFNFNLSSCNGNEIEELINVFDKNDKIKKTSLVLASTVKGKGFSIMENKNYWHYMNKMSTEEIKQAREEIQ
jgi:transketolase